MLTEIKSIIKLYFPDSLKFGSEGYIQSIEQKNFRKLCERVKNSDETVLMYNDLKAICKGYEVIFWTNFDLYDDIEFKILLHKGQAVLDNDIQLLEKLAYQRRDLEIFISLIGKYYYLLPIETQYKDKKYDFNYEFRITKEMENLIRAVQSYFLENNYKEIDDQTANTIIQDVETELQPRGKATVFNLLFNDTTSIPKSRTINLRDGKP